MPTSLVLVDDHPIFLYGLRHLFGTSDDFTVLSGCGTAQAAIDAVSVTPPDVLLLDLHLPDHTGLWVLRELAARRMALPTVIMTAELDDEDIVEAVRLGARGLLLKELAPELVLTAVREVAAGGFWVEKRSAARALEHALHQHTNGATGNPSLTAREVDIIRALAAGMRNKEIAVKLSISEGTVKVHLHHVYEKLKVDGRLALMLYARNTGLIDEQ
jgi:DNA-binding NarL/FixJ family response regulator